MKICKTCDGNNFIKITHEGVTSYINCPNCTVDGKKEFPDFADRVIKGKSLPSMNAIKLLSYQPIENPIFFGHYKEATWIHNNRLLIIKKGSLKTALYFLSFK